MPTVSIRTIMWVGAILLLGIWGLNLLIHTLVVWLCHLITIAPYVAVGLIVASFFVRSKTSV